MPEVIEFLKNEKFDVICLQEFPIEYLEKLSSLFSHYIFEKELLVYKNGRKKTTRVYTVTISRIPIKNTDVIQHKEFYEEGAKRERRYRNFRAHSIYADIDVGKRKMRIFNVHFKCVAGSHHRFSQFREILHHFDPERENIICGDLNTFSRPIINIFIWKYFGLKVKELFIHEKKSLKRIFDLHKLKNPFENFVTFLKFPVQLDYILLPTLTKMISKRRFLRRRGSDHFPISVEI